MFVLVHAQEKRFFGAICWGLLGLSKAKIYTVIMAE